ncbi:TlpA family protein disulfide reductase [Nocardioides deserti]|uniref:TlpA family protein disulfide reductase n=1 Tax=Nocardioides deserti TaxID=1588644 RepID=A0ABR6U6A5_9ACTN|nr:TlpA disulfide reductase family protein [Nocardioides deserti]MBC2959381.1 TlpA family protein disulfide reductase [Nocardioides deserti]GGO73336.1 hypothetical protein GCM10012276_18670 [Nocardioides deserti]
MRPRALQAALLLLTSVTLTACGGFGTVSGTGDKGFIAGDGVVQVLPKEDRERPGELSGDTLDGDELALSDFAGKIVVVNVWGSWCGPCRAEAPALADAAADLAEDDVRFLGVNLRESSVENARAFAREFSIPYPSIVNDGDTLLAFAGTLPVQSVPTTVVVDEEGLVAARVLGEVSRSTLVGIVDEVRDR